MKIFNRGNICEYSKKCSGYQEDSHTCTEALDKSYCGMWKRFAGVELDVRH